MFFLLILCFCHFNPDFIQFHLIPDPLSFCTPYSAFCRLFINTLVAPGWNCVPICCLSVLICESWPLLTLGLPMSAESPTTKENQTFPAEVFLLIIPFHMSKAMYKSLNEGIVANILKVTGFSTTSNMQFSTVQPFCCIYEWKWVCKVIWLLLFWLLLW